MLPRLIRHHAAPGYLGVDRNRFDAEVRPSLTEVPIGSRGIAFDRIETRRLGRRVYCRPRAPESQSDERSKSMRTRTPGILCDRAGERTVNKQHQGERIFARLGKVSQDQAGVAQGATGRSRCQTRTRTTRRL